MQVDSDIPSSGTSGTALSAGLDLGERGPTDGSVAAGWAGLNRDVTHSSKALVPFCCVLR